MSLVTELRGKINELQESMEVAPSYQGEVIFEEELQEDELQEDELQEDEFDEAAKKKKGKPIKWLKFGGAKKFPGLPKAAIIKARKAVGTKTGKEVDVGGGVVAIVRRAALSPSQKRAGVKKPTDAIRWKFPSGMVPKGMQVIVGEIAFLVPSKKGIAYRVAGRKVLWRKFKQSAKQKAKGF